MVALACVESVRVCVPCFPGLFFKKISSPKPIAGTMKSRMRSITSITSITSPRTVVRRAVRQALPYGKALIQRLWCLQTLLIWWGYGEIDNEIDNLDNLDRVPPYISASVSSYLFKRGLPVSDLTG